MRISELNCTHESYDAEVWRDYDALYEGGQKFRCRVTRFLKQNPLEPAQVYTDRCSVAHYRSYLGPVVDYFSAFLFTSQIAIRAQVAGEPVEPDEYYARFKEACDGHHTDLADFLRARFTRALVDGCALWMVEKPRASAVRSKAEWREQGLGDAILKPLDREALLDWFVDESGAMLWCVVRHVETYRPRPGAKQIVRTTWRIYDQTTVTVYRHERAIDEPLDTSKEAALVEQYSHGFQEIPLVTLRVPVGLWVANRIESPQREHFALSNAHTWGIRKTCFATPVFHVEDDARPPRMGAGYYLMIGVNERMEWAAPPSVAFDAISREVDAQRDEIYRIVHQMALGVDNNAATIGRSGESKAVDASSTKVVLAAYGACVREAVEETYELLTQARGEDYTWSIEGLDKYDAADVASLVDAVSKAILLDIPSPTFHREVRKRAALSLVSDTSQQVKDRIVQEIEKNTPDEIVKTPSLDESEPEDEQDEEPEQDDEEPTEDDE